MPLWPKANGEARCLMRSMNKFICEGSSRTGKCNYLVFPQYRIRCHFKKKVNIHQKMKESLNNHLLNIRKCSQFICFNYHINHYCKLSSIPCYTSANILGILLFGAYSFLLSFVHFQQTSNGLL